MDVSTHVIFAMKNPNLAHIKQTAFKSDVYEPAEVRNHEAVDIYGYISIVYNICKFRTLFYWLIRSFST